MLRLDLTSPDYADYSVVQRNFSPDKEIWQIGMCLRWGTVCARAERVMRVDARGSQRRATIGNFGEFGSDA